MAVPPVGKYVFWGLIFLLGRSSQTAKRGRKPENRGTPPGVSRRIAEDLERTFRMRHGG
jgi:hypothetical protein